MLYYVPEVHQPDIKKLEFSRKNITNGDDDGMIVIREEDPCV